MTTLTNLNIWDGETVLDANTLVFDTDGITQVGHSDDIALGADAIDCGGLTAIPGLIDAHVHLELNPDEANPPARTEDRVIPLMAERAAAMAAVGITTARDLGGGAWHELALRDAIAAGKQVGPRLLCSGQPITSPQGHCHFWGGEAHNLEEAKGVLQRQVEHGVDLIKIMATGGRLTKGSEPTDAQFDQATMNAIVDMAKAHDLPVAAHCHGTEGIHRAALAGVTTIEHCSWVGQDGWASDYQEDIARIVLDRGVWVSPTVNKGWQRMLDSKTGNVPKTRASRLSSHDRYGHTVGGEHRRRYTRSVSQGSASCAGGVWPDRGTFKCGCVEVRDIGRSTRPWVSRIKPGGCNQG